MTSLTYKDKGFFALWAILFLLVVSYAALTEQFFLLAIPFVLLLVYAAWQQGHIIWLLLLACLPLSVEYNLTPSLATDLPDEPLMWLCSFIALVLLIHFPNILTREKIRHPLIVLLGLVLFWAAISSLLSTHPLLSLKYLLAKGWYVGAFVLLPFLLFKSKKQVITATGVLMFSILCITVVILARHAAYNFRFASVHEAVTPFFRNHVNYAAMLVCCIPLFIAARRLSHARYRKLFTLFILVMLAALFFAYSRGAWLALATGMTGYWLIKKRKMFLTYVISAALLIGAFIWISAEDRYLRFAHDYKSTIFHTDFNEHLVATYKLKDVSTAERFYRWTAAVRMIKDNPVTGTGPNTFYQEYKPYAVPAYKTWVSNNPDHSTVHNYFLLTIAEQGITGLALLLILLGALFFYTEKLYHRIDDPFYKHAVLATGVMLVMICTLNFLSDLIETDKIGSLFFLCLSFLVIADVNTRNPSDSSPHIKRIS